MNFSQEPTEGTEQPQACAINYSFEHAPVHPKCKVFSDATITAYIGKLWQKGNTTAIAQLEAAVAAVKAQPRQGAWHEFESGRVGHTYIIPLEVLRGMPLPQLLKLGSCMCQHCQAERRAN